MSFDRVLLAPYVQRLRRLLSPRERLLQDLRARWGRPGDKDGAFTTRYFDLTRDSIARHVDDRTWVDLELPSTFTEIDTTVTPIGSQWLFRRLRAYGENEDDLARRQAVYYVLRDDQSLREAIQLKLAYVNVGASDGIADHLFGELPEKPPHHRLVLAWSTLSIVALVLVVAFSLTPWLWLPFVAVNAIVMHVGGLRISRDADVFRACGRMLRAADGLAQIPDSRVPELLSLVTTHDVELQSLLADRFELFHFREDPEVESLFDYRLRPGATTARNAIRLLERFGFPPPIVRAALRYAG